MYDEKARENAFLDFDYLGQRPVLPAALLGSWLVCRAVYPDYAVQFAEFNMISSIGGFVFGFRSSFSCTSSGSA